MGEFRSLGGVQVYLEEAGIVPFPACPEKEGSVAVVCLLRDGKLTEVCLTVEAARQCPMPTADQQRAFLFALFCLRDPCPDARRSCVFQSGEATVSICADPRLGGAAACVAYR